MLLFEKNIQGQHAIVIGEPKVADDRKTYSVLVEIFTPSPKFAGFPDRALVRGNYSLPVFQRLAKGNEIRITGGYNRSHSPDGQGQIIATSIAAKSRDLKAFMSGSAISDLRIDSEEMTGERLESVMKLRALLDKVTQFETELATQERCLEPRLLGFLRQNPAHLVLEEKSEQASLDAWDAASHLVYKANKDHYSGRQFVIPERALMSLLGPIVSNAIERFVIESGIEVIKEKTARPNLVSVSHVLDPSPA